jgi:hypothetical protein
MNDLWPDDIEVVDIKSPVAVLREQASALGQRTKNIVQAEVEQSNQNYSEDNFYYQFYIVAPALNNYRYRLFSMSHDICLYPLSIDVEAEIGEELENAQLEENQYGESYILEIKTESELMEGLKAVFSANKTKRVIKALLAQSANVPRKSRRDDVPLPPPVEPEEDIPF